MRKTDSMSINPIGRIGSREDKMCIVIDPAYAAGLTGLEGYSHVQVLWWADRCDNKADRSVLTEKRPYRNGPEEIGVFALRSPERPNPVAVSTVNIKDIDIKTGIVDLYWIDACDGTPVIDLKPYTPSLDRVERPVTPGWSSHWPKYCEDNGDFDWNAEFNF